MRVLSLSRDSIPCEFATRVAVDAGLQVVKPESAAGDPLRQRSPGFFAYLTAGKERVDVDEASLREQAQHCAAVVADEWGRDLALALGLGKPLIVVGERDSTALAGVPPGCCDEFLAFHAGGLGFITPRVMPGYPSAGPLCPDAHLVEFMVGLYGAIALFALLGDPQAAGAAPRMAAIGLTGATLPLLRREIASVLYDNNDPHRSERIWKVSPAEIHRCRDGWVFVNAIEDDQWQRLCKYMGREDLLGNPDYATRELRFAHADSISTAVDQFFAPRSQASWRDAQAIRVPVAPVNSINDLLTDPHLQARGFWTTVHNAQGAALRVPTTPLARLFGALDQAPIGAAKPATPSSNPGPLSGIRVLELTHVWAGPFCGQILADLGAEVIRVENRAHLDIHRRGGPYPQGQAGLNRSGTWNAQNRGKLGCTLDIKTPQGRELFLALVRDSDVVIENFTPGTLDKLGVGFETLRDANPRVILLSLSGYGQTGPYRDSLAYGPMMDAATGLSAATAYADGVPRAVNGWAADIGGALYGCAAITRALLTQPRAAVHLDVSQFEAGVLFTTEALIKRVEVQAAPAPADALQAALETRETDRWIALSAQRPAERLALCTLLGVAPEAPREQLEQALQLWAATRDRKDALAAIAAVGVPVAPISTTRELLSDERLRERAAWLEVQHPETAATLSYGPPIRLAETPANTRPAPLLGQHNDYVFGQLLKLTAQDIEALSRQNII